MRTLPILALLLPGCASLDAPLTTAHDALSRAPAAYAALCPTHDAHPACRDLRDALNFAITAWNALPEETE